jgi:hypothetical protein
MQSEPTLAPHYHYYIESKTNGKIEIVRSKDGWGTRMTAYRRARSEVMRREREGEVVADNYTRQCGDRNCRVDEDTR